jgi:putative transferase (TIGR04331 family)
MFLATTALTDFWDKDQELLFLGQWCRLYERHGDWEGVRGRMLASPWDEPGQVERGAADMSCLHEALLGFLSGFLDETHGVRHDERYWRIILGPWLLGFTAAVVDHGLHLDRAFAAEPGLETWTLDPRDHRTPLDTDDFRHMSSTDLFQLQLYSEMLAERGHAGRSLRRSEPERPRNGPAAWKSGVRAAFARAARAVFGHERVFADFYASRRRTLALMRAASLAPLGQEVASPRAPIDPARRAGLAGFRTSVPFAAEAAALLPRHLPILFLEGHAEFRRAVLARWPRLPRLLLTSVGWYANETFKLLAAEAVEHGASLILSQHGGAYGMMEPIFSERHERRISDRYATWGWNDGLYPGAALVPLPSPQLDGPRPVPTRRTGDWLLITATMYRYPYTFYAANAPAAHRFIEQIEGVSRFVRGVGDAARSGLRVRLHRSDFGWGHRARLVEEFPRLAFDDSAAHWKERADLFDLVAIDHPQTSLPEALALDKPTLLFWRPELWRMRPEAAPFLDGLRRAGILFDSAEDAARAAPAILADPASWWARPEARSARAAFCARYARSSPDWLSDWKRALAEAQQ